ncbi:MAG: hypothetical protein IKN56_07915 [Clostridia bacterium]|nr:hypothetical protein [Clostridia bacterium]
MPSVEKYNKLPGNRISGNPVFLAISGSFWGDFGHFLPILWLFTKLSIFNTLFQSLNINENREKIYEDFTKFFCRNGCFLAYFGTLFAVSEI